MIDDRYFVITVEDIARRAQFESGFPRLEQSHPDKWSDGHVDREQRRKDPFPRCEHV